MQYDTIQYNTIQYNTIQYSKNPHIRTKWYKNLQAEIWRLNTQNYKNLFSLAKKKKVLIQIQPLQF